MAKIRGGITGRASGKFGNAVAGSIYGIDYIRSLPKKRTSKFTEGEVKTHNALKTVHSWLQPLLEVLRVGFQGYSQTSFGYNAAKSFNYRNALRKEEVPMSLDPSRVQVSYGDLGMSESMACDLNEDRQLLFSWDTGIRKDMGMRDQVMLLAYDPEIKASNYTTSGGFRMSGSATLDLSKLPTGLYHIYAAFVAENRDRQSHSVYLGEIAL